MISETEIKALVERYDISRSMAEYVVLNNIDLESDDFSICSLPDSIDGADEVKILAIKHDLDKQTAEEMYMVVKKGWQPVMTVEATDEELGL